MDSVEDGGASEEFLRDLLDLLPHVTAFVEATLAVLHFAAKIRARIKPVPRTVRRLVTGAVQVVQAIGNPP